MKKLYNDSDTCAVIVLDKKTKKLRRCKNKRTDGNLCTIHSTVRDCGGQVKYWDK